MNKQDRFLFIFLKTAPCSCRCRHCDFAVSGAFPALPLERAIEFVEPFVRARDAQDVPYGKLAVFLGDAPLNYPDLAGGLRYLREHDIEGWYSIPVNGFRLRSEQEWSPYLEGIRKAGAEILEFTLYGQRETHDWFARRPGDFRAIQELARLWHEQLGGKTSWSAFAHKASLHELEGLTAEILAAHGETLWVRTWSYLGFAATLAQEDLRPDVADLVQLGERLQAELGGVKPEREWVAELSSAKSPPYPEEPRVMHVTVDHGGRASIPYKGGFRFGHRRPTRIGQFPVASAQHLLIEWAKAYEAWRSSYPPLAVLSERFGDPTGTKLYTRESVVDKWCSKLDEEHTSSV